MLISFPLPSNRRMAPSDTSTFSPNCNVTCRGGVVRMAFASGVVEINCAWANAGDASSSTIAPRHDQPGHPPVN